MDARRLAAETGGPMTDDVTFTAYATRWRLRIRPRVRPATYRHHLGALDRYLVPALGPMPLVRIRPDDIERMTAGMAERGLAPTTAAQARKVARLVLADALRDGLVTRNVAALARPPYVPEREPTYLDADQCRRLLDAATTWRPLWAVLLGTGLRLGEARGLRWSDVDLADGRLSVRRSYGATWAGKEGPVEPKSRAARRSIPLAGLVADALTDLRERQAVERFPEVRNDPAAVVFGDAAGRPVGAQTVRDALRADLERAGLPRIRVHDLRASASVLLLSQNVSIRVIADILGHGSSLATVARHYAHVTDPMRRDAATAMERALGEGTVG
jgi:integrase